MGFLRVWGSSLLGMVVISASAISAEPLEGQFRHFVYDHSSPFVSNIEGLAEIHIYLVGDAAFTGAVHSDPPGLECLEYSCWGQFQPGIEVTLHAEATDEYAAFTGWEGVDCPGLGACTVVAEDTLHLSARFEYMPEIYVNLFGDAAQYGNVYSEPEGLDCGEWACWGLFHPGIEVTLHAEATDEYAAFTGWEGVDCPGLGACTVVAEDLLHLSARFEYMVELQLEMTGDGSGRVYSTPAAIDCPDEACNALLSPGTEVTLIAEPAQPNHYFGGWPGVQDCSDGPVCQITVETDQVVTAEFLIHSNEIHRDRFELGE